MNEKAFVNEAAGCVQLRYPALCSWITKRYIDGSLRNLAAAIGGKAVRTLKLIFVLVFGFVKKVEQRD